MSYSKSLSIASYAICAALAATGIFLRLLPRDGGDGHEISAKSDQKTGIMEEKTDWPVFRGDCALSGHSSLKIGGKLSRKWEFTCGKSSTPVAGKGKIYLVDEEGFISALDCRNGTRIWKTAAGIGRTEAPPLLHDGTVFVGNEEGTFAAFDSADGREKWRIKVGGAVKGAANFWKDPRSGRVLVIFGSYDSSLYAVEASDGRTVWSFKSEGYINGSAAIGQDLAVFGGCDGHLRVVSPAEGRELSSTDTGSYIPANPSMKNGSFCCANFAGKVVMLDPKSGETLWTQGEEEAKFSSGPATDGERIVLCSSEGLALCLASKDGSVLWKVKVPAEISFSPTICGDKIVAGGSDGRLYILDLAGGNIFQEIDLGSPVSSSPIVADGGIIVCTGDGRIISFSDAGR